MISWLQICFCACGKYFSKWKIRSLVFILSMVVVENEIPIDNKELDHMFWSGSERQNNVQNSRYYQRVKIPIPKTSISESSNASFENISGAYSNLFDYLDKEKPGNPEQINYQKHTIEAELVGKGEYKPSGSIQIPMHNETLYSTAATDSSIEFKPSNYFTPHWSSDANNKQYPQPMGTIESTILSSNTPAFTSQFKTNPEYGFEMRKTAFIQPSLQNKHQNTLTIPGNTSHSLSSHGLFTKVIHSFIDPTYSSTSPIQNALHPSQWVFQNNSLSQASMQQPHHNMHHHQHNVEQPFSFVPKIQNMFRTAPPPALPTQLPIYPPPPPPNIQSYSATVPPQPLPTYPIFHSWNMTPIQTTTFAAPQIQYPFYINSTPQFYHSFPIERKQQKQIFAD